jgi:hypothetical protein
MISICLNFLIYFLSLAIRIYVSELDKLKLVDEHQFLLQDLKNKLENLNK